MIRAAFVLLAAALLGGCFYSDRPLIGRLSAQFPLAEGVYSHTPYHPDGRPFERPMWTGEIEHRGGRYVSDSENFPHQGARLRELAPGIYAAMRESDDVYLYGLLYVYEDGRVATYHQPQCARLAEAARTTYELVEHETEQGACQVSDWDRLEGALLSYINGLDGDVPVDGVYRRLD